MKVVVIDKKEYTVKYDQYLDYTFIHCDINTRWTKAVKAQLKEDFNQLLKLRESPLFAMHELGDEKHLKFLQQFGFKYYQDVVGNDDILRQVYFTGNNYGS